MSIPDTPATREEMYLSAIANGDSGGIPETPYTRKEMYLEAIATGDPSGIPETPYTREEMYLDEIARNGGGGGGGGDITVVSKSISANGTHTAPPGKAYSPVIVDVPNSYAAGDEGKVVSNGELVAQTAHEEVTQNGTIDTTLNNSVVVNVSGGGADEPIPAPLKDVVFVDYDGEIVEQYTADEFLALSALPANPSHTGLIAQGWNWTLADAQTYVQSHGCLCIGQNYTTSDGKTRLHIHLSEQIYPRSLALKFNLTNPTTLAIDWGDGNTETLSGSGNKSISHTYSAVGDYLLTVGCTGAYGWGDTTTNPAGVSGGVASAITEINIGNGVTRLYGYAFSGAANCKKISVPTGISDFSVGRNYGYALAPSKCLVYPSGTTNIQTIGSAQFISFPKSVTAISSTFGSQLRMISLPEGASITGYGKNLQRAERISIPGLSGAVGGGSNTTTWGTSWYCRSFTFGTGVTSILAAGFNRMQCSEIHLLATTPPALNGANAFRTSYLEKIYVPYSEDHSVLAAYQSASNWSTFASIMEEELQ